MQGPTGPAKCARPTPTKNTSGATTFKCLLTWPSVARCTVFIGIVAALAGTLSVALQNVAALVRGAEVAFVEW